VASDRARPHVGIDASTPVVLARVAAGGAPTVDRYRATGGYVALEAALAVPPSRLVDELECSGMRGRGGAAFPTGRKWRAAAAVDADERYVVANADEGDPGAFGDRIVLEEDPHAVIEGLAIAALAIGARRGVVYVRKEYPDAASAIARAVADARAAGVLGVSLLGSGPAFDVDVAVGEGSYVCGEETALLEALEGRRPTVRVRPPFPAERGLFGRPTVVNNVETLAAVPWIVANGGAAYAAMGTPSSPGTKVLSLSSLFQRPGLYEVELGLPVRDVVERIGGGLTNGALRGVLVGGPLAGILPAHLLDVALDFDALRAVGCEVGHGGIVAFDEHTSIVELVRHVFRFAAYESCGTCTPCRLGAARVEALLEPDAGRAAPDEVAAIIDALGLTSLCGHGTGLAAFARSAVTHYREELEPWLG
jgi:formate dehydrogenase iron-sulfur subunit